MEELRPIALDPGQLLTRINRDLRAILQQTGTPLFTTAFYLVADLERRQIITPMPAIPGRSWFIDSGAPSKSSNMPTARPAPPWACSQKRLTRPRRATVAGGDLVMLFTDGLYEVEGRDGEQFSQDLLLEAGPPARLAARRGNVCRNTGGNSAILPEP